MEINVLLSKCLGLSVEGESDTGAMMNMQVYREGKSELEGGGTGAAS